jgi:hypothetical protein
VGYLKAIKRLSQEDNTGGLVQLKVCRKADIASIPSPVGAEIFGDITFVGAAAFLSWDISISGTRIQNPTTQTIEGATKKNTLPFSVPKDRSDLRDMFRLMEEDEFIVLFTENGRQKIFGTLEKPVKFIASHDSGADIGDKNAIACQFYYNGPDNIFFYAGTGGVAPVGPAPAIVRFNGTPIASLAPGEILDIDSDYSLADYFVTS